MRKFKDGKVSNVYYCLMIEKPSLSRRYFFLIVLTFVLEVIAKYQGAATQGCAKGRASAAPNASDLEGRL